MLSSGRTLGVLEERKTTSVELPINQDLLPLAENNVKLDVITGELPRGMRLDGHLITGTPFEVQRDTPYSFVVRAEQYGQFDDRTYTIMVHGPDDPIWVTPEGVLPVGPNDVYFILDSAIIDFQLIAYDPDTIAGDNLEYYIQSGEGELPPGITLTREGRLQGITEPILEIERVAGSGNYDSNNFSTYPYDFGIISDIGYDSFEFDTTEWDKHFPSRVPNKLNRFYEFIVTISDGDSISRRKFQIYLVGDDFLRADNTIMRVSNGVFTADNSYVRTPVWLTPADLGYRRANNYVTVFLDVIDLNTLTGIITYELQDYNPDGTSSIMPPGLTLDYYSGELAGRVPYQSAITKEYKFTIRALRRVPNDPERTFKDKTFTIKLMGEIDSYIQWISESDLGSISANFNSNLRLDATTTLPNGSLKYNLVSGKLPPGLHLSIDGDIIGKVKSFGSEGDKGITVFDNNNTTFDKNASTIDRVYEFRVKVRDRTGFSAIERDFKLAITDPDHKLYSNLYIQPLFKEAQREAFREIINNHTYFDSDMIYRPADPNFGIQQNMRMLVYAGIETKETAYYVSVLAKNNKRKQYRLGDIKTAIARTIGTRQVVYEVVYIDVIDPAENDKGVTRKAFDTRKTNSIKVDQTMYDLDRDSVERPDPFGLEMGTRGGDVQHKFDPYLIVQDRAGRRLIVDYENLYGVEYQSESFIQNPNEPWRFRPDPENTTKADYDGLTIDGLGKRQKFISNIHHVRDNIRNIGETEINYLPLWMRTSQYNSIEELGYVKAIPLCFCKPNMSKEIYTNLKRANITFKDFNFDIDRIIIDSTEGVSQNQYLVFHNYSYNV